MIATPAALLLLAAFLVAEERRVVPPATEGFRPVDFFPVDVGNTWIWGGAGVEYSVRTITDSKRMGDGEGEEITFESTSRRGAIQYYDEFVLAEDGRLYRKAVRFLAGTSIEYAPPVLYCPFSGRIGDTVAAHVSESTGGSSPKRYFRRVTIVERRSVGTVLGSFGDCVIVRIEEFESESDSKSLSERRPLETIDVWFARDVGPIKFRGVDKAGRVTEHQVVFARVGGKRLGLDPREGAN